VPKRDVIGSRRGELAVPISMMVAAEWFGQASARNGHARQRLPGGGARTRALERGSCRRNRDGRPPDIEIEIGEQHSS